MKSKPIVTMENADRHIEEISLDCNQRARNSLEYEQMLMNFISEEFSKTFEGR